MEHGIKHMEQYRHKCKYVKSNVFWQICKFLLLKQKDALKSIGDN